MTQPAGVAAVVPMILQASPATAIEASLTTPILVTKVSLAVGIRQVQWRDITKVREVVRLTTALLTICRAVLLDKIAIPTVVGILRATTITAEAATIIIQAILRDKTFPTKPADLTRMYDSRTIATATHAPATTRTMTDGEIETSTIHTMDGNQVSP